MKAIFLLPIVLVTRLWNFIRSVWAEAVSANTRSDGAQSDGHQLSKSPIALLMEVEKGGMDLTFMGPTTQCACGSNLFHVVAWFDEQEREIAGRFLEMACVSCGSYCKSPTPID
jgi:hypothetical protein